MRNTGLLVMEHFQDCVGVAHQAPKKTDVKYWPRV